MSTCGSGSKRPVRAIVCGEIVTDYSARMKKCEKTQGCLGITDAGAHGRLEPL